MKYSALFCGLMIGLLHPIHAQITEEWSSPDLDYARNGVMVAADADGNSFAVSDIFHGDIYLTKRDPAGNILWSTGYDNTTPSQWEQASWVTTDINNDVIVTGYTNVGYGTPHFAVQMVTMKFNGEDGALIWRITDNAGSAKRGRVVMTDAAGDIYIGGEYNAYNTTYYELGVMMLWKYNSAGILQWTITTDLSGNQMAGPFISMKWTPEGQIAFAGAASMGASVTGGRATTSGTLLWTHGFPAYGVADIDADDLGNTFLLYSYAFGPMADINVGIKKINAAGSVIWDHNYDFGTADLGRRILADNMGGAYVTGYSSQLAGMPYVDWLTFRVNAVGDTLWSDRYNEHENNDEWPWMMVRDNEGNIYVTGQGGPWPGYFWLSLTQMVTVKYTPEGSRDWTGVHTTYASVGKAVYLHNDNVLYALGEGYAVVLKYALPVTCDAPIGLFTNNITTTKARVNWTLEPGAMQYEVWYKKTTAATWKKKIVAGINNKLNLKNLSCNTNYVWKIRSICDTVGVDLTSAFSPEQYFTTLVCRSGEPEETTAEISLYPNPAQQTVYLDAGEARIAEYTVYNAIGQPVISGRSADMSVIAIDVSNLEAGVYYIHCTTGEGAFISMEFMHIK